MITIDSTIELQRLINLYVNNAVKNLQKCCNGTSGSGLTTVYTQPSDSITFEGNGTQSLPLIGHVRISEDDGNTIVQHADGIFSIGGGDYTDEEAQDAVADMLANTDTIEWNYNDGIPELSADVIIGGIDNALMEFVMWTGTELKRRTLASLPFLTDTDQGKYTPTLFNETNITSSGPLITNFVKIGNWVHVWGALNISVTASGTIAVLGMSLPVAFASSLVDEQDLAGTAAAVDVTSVAVSILADIVNDRAVFRFIPLAVTSGKYSFHFSYLFET